MNTKHRTVRYLLAAMTAFSVPAVTTPAIASPVTAPDGEGEELLAEGIYRTRELTRDELIAAGVAAGFDAEGVGAFIDADADGMEATVRFGLRLAAGFWDQLYSYDGGPERVGWHGEYGVVDDHTVIATDPGASITYEFAVEGDQLSLDVLTIEDNPDDPYEVDIEMDLLIQTLIFETAPFTLVEPAQPETSDEAASTTYTSTTFVVPFEVTLPDWLPAGTEPFPARPNFVTWESAVPERAIRFLVPASVYPPGTSTAADVPVDYVAYLLAQADHGAVFEDVVETTVDGWPATIVSATTPTFFEGSLGCEPEGECWGLITDAVLRLAVIEVGDQPILIWVRDIRGVAAEYDTFDAMLASLRFLEVSGASEPSGDTSDATSDPEQSSTTTVGSGLQYVAFGDSWPQGAHCAGCTTFVGLWAEAIEAQTGNDVHVTDFTGAAEASTAESKASASLLRALQTDEPTRDAVRTADIILIATGPNELDVLGETCAGPDDLDCVRDLGAMWAENFEAILTEIDLLRQGSPTVVRLVNAANLWVMVPEAIPAGAADDFATAGQGALVFELLTTAICDAAEAHDAICVDVRPVITGPNLDQPGDENSPATMQAIADALVATGLPELGFESESAESPPTTAGS